jgi:uncharacterized membrane protein
MEILIAFMALPGIWVILQSLASLLFASENFIEEWLLARLKKTPVHSSEDTEGEPAPIGILILISGLFGPVIAIFFAIVAYILPDQSVTLAIGINLSLKATVVGMLEVVWLIPYLYALNHAGAIKAAPLFQTIPVISLILGLVFFSEIPPIVHIVAAASIIAGGLLLDLREMKGKWQIDKKTIGLMLFASTVIAFISFVFKDTALEGNFVATAFYGGIGMTISGLLFFLFYAPYRNQFLTFCKEADGSAVLAQLINEVVDVAAMTASRLAMVIGPSVMAVSALNAWQPVFILVIGWVLARRGSAAHSELLEGVKFKQTACAITLLVIGTVLITF